MLKTTRAQVELLDATGRCPVPASQAVRTKKLILPEDRIAHGEELISDAPRVPQDLGPKVIKHEPSGELAAIPELQGSWGECHAGVQSSQAAASTKLAQVFFQRVADSAAVCACVSSSSKARRGMHRSAGGRGKARPTAGSSGAMCVRSACTGVQGH